MRRPSLLAVESVLRLAEQHASMQHLFMRQRGRLQGLQLVMTRALRDRSMQLRKDAWELLQLALYVNM